MERKSSAARLPETEELEVKESTFITGELGVIVKRHYKKGEVLFIIKGPIQPQPTKYSFAASLDRHIEPQREDGVFDFGHYLNHSCDPNVMVRLVDTNTEASYIEIIARQDIKAGQEIAFDYASLEYEVTVANVACRCNTLECRGVIHGFKDLPADIVERYKVEGMIPDYLLQIPKK